MVQLMSMNSTPEYLGIEKVRIVRIDLSTDKYE